MLSRLEADTDSSHPIVLGHRDSMISLARESGLGPNNLVMAKGADMLRFRLDPPLLRYCLTPTAQAASQPPDRLSRRSF